MDYQPYFDDAMTGVMGNVGYVNEAREKARAKAIRKYKETMMKHSYPYVPAANAAMYDAPYGLGMKAMKYQTKLLKHRFDPTYVDMMRAKMAKVRAAKGYGYKLPDEALVSKMREYNTQEDRMKQILNERMLATAPKDLARRAAKRLAKKKALKALKKQLKATTDPTMTAIAPTMATGFSREFLSSTDGQEYNRIKASLKELKQTIKDLKAAKTDPKAQKRRMKLKKQKAAVKAMKASLRARMLASTTPTLAMPTQAMPTTTTAATGLLTARGLIQARGTSARGICARGMISARGTKQNRLIHARAAGGFLGALAGIAAPLAIQGAKWLGKKLKQKIDAKKAQKSLQVPKTEPNNMTDVFRKAYSMVQKTLPGLVPDEEAAKKLMLDFVTQHATKLLGSVPVKDTTPSTATVGDVMAQLAPTDVKDEFRALSDKPIGSGIMEDVLSVVKAPETKALLSSAAQLILPKIGSRVKRFLKNKFFKKKKPVAPVSDTTRPVGGEILQGVKDLVLATPMDTMHMSTAYATPGAIGPATADAYRYSGSGANMVYELAKKM
jgi:hypothetical protein